MLLVLIAAAAISGAAYLITKMSKALMVRAWVKDHIYLVQYPRAGVIPQYSPWSLKLETWLRISGLPYTNVSNGITRFSAKGQVPFIELNGKEIADSNFIIKRLKEHFPLSMDSVAAEDDARCQAINALAEDKITPCIFALRVNDNSFLLSDKGWGRHFGTGVAKTLKVSLFNQYLIYRLRNTPLIDGMRRHSDEEITEVARDGIKALSNLLGDKPYFNGDKPGTADATVFGCLAAFVYCPMPNGILQGHIENDLPKFYEFFERVKTTYWPDWEETCRTMDMNTHKNYKKEL